eukprot:2042262-Karenia_brevis.AAC.1
MAVATAPGQSSGQSSSRIKTSTVLVAESQPHMAERFASAGCEVVSIQSRLGHNLPSQGLLWYSIDKRNQ